MHELNTEIEINATPERVWEVLVDFPSYKQWNPFVRYIEGLPKVGTRLKTLIGPSGAKGMVFRPTVLVAEKNRELRWIGVIYFRALFSGDHRYVIEPLSPGKVRFVHSEIFRGILVPMMRAGLETDTKRGFEEMNAALKRQAEKEK